MAIYYLYIDQWQYISWYTICRFRPDSRRAFPCRYICSSFRWSYIMSWYDYKCAYVLDADTHLNITEFKVIMNSVLCISSVHHHTAAVTVTYLVPIWAVMLRNYLCQIFTFNELFAVLVSHICGVRRKFK